MVDLEKVEKRKVKTYDRDVFVDTNAMSDYKKHYFSNLKGIGPMSRFSTS